MVRQTAVRRRRSRLVHNRVRDTTSRTYNNLEIIGPKLYNLLDILIQFSRVDLSNFLHTLHAFQLANIV